MSFVFFGVLVFFFIEGFLSFVLFLGSFEIRKFGDKGEGGFY